MALSLASCWFQSTRPVRGATSAWVRARPKSGVSIHAPRAGRDIDHHHIPRGSDSFNPRAPCGARLAWLVERLEPLMFQSTRPVRGATHDTVIVDQLVAVSIHAPRAGRDVSLDALNTHQLWFQSTRPVRGATSRPLPRMTRRATFQSTRPVRGATMDATQRPSSGEVSIHAPRAGRDRRILTC